MSRTYTREEYLALAAKHGGFMWRYPGGEERMSFFSDEQRDAFDADLAKLGHTEWTLEHPDPSDPSNGPGYDDYHAERTADLLHPRSALS